MLTKEKSILIKGVAIIFMVSLHVIMFSGNHFLSYCIADHPIAFFTSRALKICVAIYAFLTGFAYVFVENKTVVYSLNRIWKFLKTYWFILIIVFLPLSLWGGVSGNNRICL